MFLPFSVIVQILDSYVSTGNTVIFLNIFCALFLALLFEVFLVLQHILLNLHIFITKSVAY
jgi:hypothetical protein